ncbi:TFIIIC transcription initiation factor complex subunits Tfc3 [Aspergillus terreus]|uniref:TFIIIC transcription initiation factor complex subunits Tfc3 n=1 Tax=Aspergillus terreus TaxID=33178 RepID=A0A5M3YWD5_ASPTE|nr:hypothetical protein ATETN484_0004038700 [Aspergillus terreus]GFF13277.1 TFIIIC transcription initiation factor complex subunits Tfc3 [Aspergillus terreus]
MAPSFRDLIDYLLADIALCGDQGATPADILESTKAFYAKPAQHASSRTHTVDRRFQEKVWTWLTRNPEVSVGHDKEGNHLTLADAEGRAQGVEPLRVFVSKERTWLALTGHEPDDTKVFPTEFALLSIIASHKSKGIAQTDLVRISGQDKRSVPKRTDTLQRKGYIQKRAVQIKSARTSLCTLRRFLKDEDSVPESASESADCQNQMIDFHKFMDDLFSILRQHKILSRNDLKNLLGFADRWRWRILSRTLRKFERIGVLKRVRALSQYADTVNKYHPCVMLVREPTEKDYERFYEFGIDSLTNNEQEDSAELDEEMMVTDTGQPSVALQNGVLQQGQVVQDVGRTIPCWTPDRVLHNQIFDIVHQAGTDGMISLDLIKSCFGGFYRRPLENVLARLVECWQLSQPLHLRHLALVRDTAMTGTIHHYIHYSAVNFRKRVDAGEAAWEAVEFISKNAKANNLRPPPVDAVPEVDGYGLPLARPKSQLFKNGNASLLECMAVVKPQDYVVTSTDPSVVQLQDGTYGLRIRQRASAADHHRRGGVEASTPLGVKLEHHEPEDVDMENTPEVSKPTVARRKKIKNEDLLRGMSEKEKLENLGLDETYTEYSVLLIERPNPGVYLTPLGRRRPAGKRQGRPKRSRVVVFKSPKLSSLPWFVKEVGEDGDRPESDAGQDISLSTAEPSDTGLLRGTKRPLHLSSGRDSDTESPVVSKQRRLVKGEQASMDVDTPELHPSANGTRISKRKRAESPGGDNVSQASQTQARTTVDAPETPSKRPHHEVRGDYGAGRSVVVPGNDGATDEPVKGAHDTNLLSPPTGKRLAEAAPPATAPTAVPPTTPSIPSSMRTAQPTATPASAEPASSPAPASSTGKMRGLRGHMSGSIGFQRRKIVMQILEQAGGAFPMGTELWYPFTTAWAKLKYKEKPDLRTIRNTVKHLIDVGTLRQFTFSGKDSKGLMVTKSIIAKSDLSPDDPLIQDMQKKMLATDSRFYIPENVEYDREMTKSGKKVQVPPYGKSTSRIPIEPRLTVHLHQKPALVTAQEKRKGQMIQRRLLQRLDSERELLKGPSVVRLMRIRRAPGQGDTAHGLTSISRPDRSEGQKQRRIQKVQSSGGIRRGRLIDLPISEVWPFAMVMSPRQEFHASSGTFSTTAVLGALRISEPTVSQKEPLTLHGRRKDTTSDLPDSLDDLFNMAHQEREPVDPDRTFSTDLTTIMRWEIRNKQLFRRKSSDFHYINQTVQDSFESAPIVGNIRFHGYEEPPMSRREHLPSEPRATRKATRTTEALAEGTLRPLAPRPPGKPRYDVDTEMDVGGRRRAFEYEEDFDTTRRNRRLEKLHASLADEGEAISIQQTGRRSHKNLYVLSRSFVRKLMTAIVVVRTLAGGWEGKIVDWNLVPKCFPEFDPIFVQERGKSIVARHRLQLAKMQGDFQSLFVEAYANGEVPAINYDDLESYDWEGVVEWANSALEFPNSEKIPDLPATREQFDSVFEVREEPVSSLDDIYHSSHNVTIYRKRTAYAETPFAVPLAERPGPMTTRQTELAHLDAVKTWVRANVVAAEESYRPAEAREILSTVRNSVLENALNSLMTERVISSNNKGRPAPGRNYDITDYFLLLLGRKRAFESTDLRRAARFKTDVLDAALRSQGQWDFDYAADDGDTMAVINLLAEGRVDLRPRDPPRDRYGLTEGGYTTRQMDKGKLRFAVEVRPVKGKYVYGNPIQEKTSSIAPPCPPSVTIGASQLAVPEKIPLWYDIHSQFVKLLWDIALTAVVSSVALRPGLSASGLANMLKPTLGAWEVELLLKWLEQVGVMRQVGGRGVEAGWAVQEWWWLVLGVE